MATELSLINKVKKGVSKLTEVRSWDTFFVFLFCEITLKRVVFRNDLTKEQALHLSMNMEGEVDIVSNVLPEKASQVSVSPYAKLVTVGGNRVVAGLFNRFQHDVNFNERKLRFALNLAVNREEIIRNAFYGYAEPIPALTPP
ncbi:ABC transporter substrate-binding protein [Halalkalibacter alkalisediminis]|uniref:ABC transporter substrate-binding protein n=1 Tax=Halalkalibacter alkalisediminis TaxID=935616 RepID=A0ABV6NG02_9BACI|nr:ABC transporter substrate-binding protein [Halalkalibacter alkalisediminis]